ncbi:MAG: hypothetical protein H0W62_11625 [Chitinophagales bacterium]|nr:hypothetical protein [Chitinophagales bacterium]
MRSKTFYVNTDTIKIDSITFFPGSVVVMIKLTQDTIPSTSYLINYSNQLLIWKTKPKTDTITISYKAFPYNFTINRFHKDFNQFNKRDSLARLPIIYSAAELGGDKLDLGTMDYNGSFSRGISFGNNQDVVVNSNFNLQLQGKLAGDVEVLGALSDNNIPIQPDGNTQQIQDFDKIFIQLKKNRSSLIVGDYELPRPESYFMNFYKKLQGADLNTAYKTGDWNLKTAASIAVSKGKYARNEFLGQEGNQGPYRLTGVNGETYIIILAGTERVFIDGVLVHRGADADYIIDYNSGEISFTPTRLITKDKRISVEFQYSDKNYFRSIAYINQEFQDKKWNVKFNFYSEQDAKNQPLSQELTDSDKIILSQAGDNLTAAYIPSVDSVAFTADRILYKKIDSLNYRIYVYSTNPDSAKYALNFSYVGSGHGNYILSSNLANGRVYHWVQPLNGIVQGNYEPVIPLIPPQKTQLVTIGTNYSLNEKTQFTWEGAFSNHDLNTFSVVSNNNNTGVASHLGYHQQIDINKLNHTELFVNATYEFKGINFNPIERYRTVEFERDWNIGIDTINTNEHYALLNANLQRSKIANVQYAFSLFNRQSAYMGFNNSVNSSFTTHGFTALIFASYLTSRTSQLQTHFFRPTIDLSQSLKSLHGITVGVHGQQENNRISSRAADTLLFSSFYWNEGRFYVHSSDSNKIRWRADYGSRVDYTPQVKGFGKATIGNTANVGAEFLSNPNSILRLNITYRKLKIADTLITQQKPDQSILGRLTYDLQAKKGFITSNTLYELGSAQQQKTEYVYTKVPDGQGLYIWIDYNQDGIQQINEFEIATFQNDANYIRISIPTNIYIEVYSNIFNESLSINPASLWKEPKGLEQFLSRFSALLTLQLNKKTLPGNFGSQFNPVILRVADSLLVSTGSLLSGFLYFNRGNPKYGLDFTYTNNYSKTLLTNGIEIRSLQDYGIRLRWNLSRKFSFIGKSDAIKKGYVIELFSQSDYAIQEYLATPQIIYQPSNIFRLSLTYGFQKSKNIGGENGERSDNNNFSLGVKYNVLSKSVIDVEGTFSNIEYHGPSNTPVQYAMLEGLQPGKNYVVNVTFDRKISSFIELSLSYQGRKTGVGKFINTGNAQVRAIF